MQPSKNTESNPAVSFEYLIATIRESVEAICKDHEDLELAILERKALLTITPYRNLQIDTKNTLLSVLNGLKNALSQAKNGKKFWGSTTLIDALTALIQSPTMKPDYLQQTELAYRTFLHQQQTQSTKAETNDNNNEGLLEKLQKDFEEFKTENKKIKDELNASRLENTRLNETIHNLTQQLEASRLEESYYEEAAAQHTSIFVQENTKKHINFIGNAFGKGFFPVIDAFVQFSKKYAQDTQQLESVILADTVIFNLLKSGNSKKTVDGKNVHLTVKEVLSESIQNKKYSKELQVLINKFENSELAIKYTTAYGETKLYDGLRQLYDRGYYLKKTERTDEKFMYFDELHKKPSQVNNNQNHEPDPAVTTVPANSI